MYTANVTNQSVRQALTESRFRKNCIASQIFIYTNFTTPGEEIQLTDNKYFRHAKYIDVTYFAELTDKG